MIKFDPKKHAYTDEKGRKYVSVTTLISQEFPFNAKEIATELTKKPGHKYYKWKVEAVLKEWRDSAGYGNRVHNACEKFLKENALPKNKKLVPLVEQFKKLRFKGKILSEQRVWDDEYLIAGTADIIEDCGDYVWLWDIKTSAKVYEDKLKKFSIQLEIYKRLIEKCLGKKCKIGGIIWFEDYVEQREKTKLRVLKPVKCKKIVDEMLAKRKKQLEA